MTPEQTAMLAAEIEKVISAEDIEETLPLTQGEGSIYRKDAETGVVNHEKVVTGAETARVTFKMSMPQIQSPDFTSFVEAAKQIGKEKSVKPEKTYTNDDIEKVRTGGIIGAMANEIIKKKHGQNQ